MTVSFDRQFPPLARASRLVPMDDSSEKAFERARRPTWLMDDIHDMMLERSGKFLFSEISALDSPTKHRPPDKSYLYKNYLREKAPNYKSDEIYQMKLRKTRIDIMNASESQKKITSFVERLRNERRKQREHQVAFMRHALDSPPPHQVFAEKMAHQRPISAGNRKLLTPNNSPPRSRVERPQTAPSHSPSKIPSPSKEYQKKLLKIQNRTPKHQSPGRSPKPADSNPLEIQKKVQQKLLTLVKILEYVNNTKRFRLYLLAEQKGKEIFVIKIQRAFRQMILRRQAYHQAVMPAIFMRYLRNYQKKSAVKKIIAFLREFSSIHSHVIVKRFMVCVRKSQIFIREMLAVKRARVQLITLYWEKIERNYRKQIEDQERETFARLQRERMARITAGSSSDLHGKWGTTHKQVVALFSHMDTVEIQRANILRDTGSSRLRHTAVVTPTTSVLSDTVDPLYRQKIIEKYVSYKRSLHLKKGVLKSPYHSRASSPRQWNGYENNGDSQPFTDDAMNIKLIKRFIHDTAPHEGNNRGLTDVMNGLKINRELLERQLASAGVAVDDDGRARKRKVAMRVFRKRPFLCLTDPSLGKPWKQIIEEVVREDIIKKKRILQEENRKTFQDRVAEDKKRGIPIPTFTSLNGRRGTDNATQAIFGIYSGNDSPSSAIGFKDKRDDDDAFSSSSSPRSSYSGTYRHRRGHHNPRLSISVSSPALHGDHSHETGSPDHNVSPRFPLL